MAHLEGDVGQWVVVEEVGEPESLHGHDVPGGVQLELEDEGGGGGRSTRGIFYVKAG